MARKFVRASSQSISPPLFTWVSGAFTVCAWIRLASIPSSGGSGSYSVESVGNGTNAFNRVLYVDPTVISFGFSVGISFQAYTFPYSFGTGEWHHIGAIPNATPNPDTCLMFLDGIQQTVTPVGAFTNNMPGNTVNPTPFIGRSPTTPNTNFFDGDIAEVMAIPVAFTADDFRGLGRGVRPIHYFQKYKANWGYYLPLVGNNSPELSPTGQSATVNSATKATSHPPMIYPGPVNA